MLIERRYEDLCKKKSDINEHLPTLYNLANECKTIVELGTRNATSTAAILAGMERDAKFISYDINESTEARELEQLAKRCNKDYTFMIGDSRGVDIGNVDMLFIDTLHNGSLLREELKNIVGKVNKYICFHDTTTFGVKGETEDEGLLKAIDEFKQTYPERDTSITYTNNNGLTILIKDNPIIVYTAIYGDFETLKKQPRQDIDTKFVCFTDRDDLDVEEGAKRNIIIDKSRPELNNRMRAKYFRTHPFEYFDADKVIYMDGSARLLREDSVRYFADQIKEHDIYNIQHPNRDNIYDEAKFCMMLTADNTGPRFTKYIGMPLIEQVEHYRSQGLPDNHIFCATGLLGVKRSNKIIDALDERFNENKERTYQDQLSFPYVVWKNDITNKYFELPGTLWKNEYIVFNPHKKPD